VSNQSIDIASGRCATNGTAAQWIVGSAWADSSHGAAAVGRLSLRAALMLPFIGYGIALLGFNLLFGTTGLLSFGHALFLGVGAYAAAALTSKFGILSFELLLIAAALASGLVALVIGALCVRYNQDFFR